MKQILFWIRFFLHLLTFNKKIRAFKNKFPAPTVVLLIANPSSIGGTEKQVEFIAKTLKSHQINFAILISGRIKSTTNLLQFPHIFIGNLGIINYKKHFKIQNKLLPLFLKFIDPKRCHTCHLFNPLSSYFAPLAKTMGLKVIYTETGYPVKDRWYLPLSTTTPYFDYITSVSKVGIVKLQELYHYKGPFSIIPSMIEPPAKESFHILYFGRLAPLKGVDILLKALHLILENHPNTHLSIIGDGESLKSLKRLSKKLKIEKAVNFISWLSPEKLWPILRSGDLFCLPSKTEGLPCSIVEAMSIGLPILATNVGGISELIENNKSGMLIPIPDEQSLFQAIKNLIDNPDLRSILGKGALDAYQNYESNHSKALKLLELYKST